MYRQVPNSCRRFRLSFRSERYSISSTLALGKYKVALAAQHEADRIADLKALCQRKGLDFDTENQKYLDRQAKKEAKAAAKAARKHR